MLKKIEKNNEIMQQRVLRISISMTYFFNIIVNRRE